LSIACSPLNDERQNCLTPYFKEILGLLLQNAKREDYQVTGIDLM
jgi:hypothetical protein